MYMKSLELDNEYDLLDLPSGKLGSITRKKNEIETYMKREDVTEKSLINICPA